ncbi:MAG: tetratricopeptide repeat protein, partial [Candidatus Gastranaerophilaceae bacterium]
MNTKNYAEINILSTINNNVDKINEILASGNFNSQNLKKLIDLYENLYNYTNDINYCKNIADIYYFYFKQKEEALKYYLAYVSKVHNDSFAYHIISLIYKSQKNNTEYKKYLDIALNSSHRKVAEPIPHSDDLVLGINIGVAAGLSMNDNVKYGLETYKKIMQYSPIPNNMITPYLDLEIKKAEQLFNDKNWQEAMIKYKNVFNNSTLQEGDFINLITCLAELKETELAMEYLRKYEESA